MESKYEYEICYEDPRCSYFKCNICGELVSLDYPETFEESEEIYASMVRKHKHKGK